MPNYLSWDAQKSLANSTVSTMSQIQDQWNVPLIVGEFCLYYFSDVWDDFLSDLNENSISWTNWNYKVRGTIYESGGGNWGYYNTWDGEDPDLMHDSAEEIEAIWAVSYTHLLRAMHRSSGIEVRVEYRILPGEDIGALMRRVCLLYTSMWSPWRWLWP